jgi:phosphoglycolate phosphatase
MDKIKNIIWDMDGTLLYTIEDLAASANYALKKNGLKERTLEEITEFVGNGLGVLAEKAVPGGKENKKFEDVLKDLREYYSKNYLVKTKPYNGIIKVLETLKSMGIKMAIVSNKPNTQLEELRQKFFADTIDLSIGDKEGQRRKPYPDGVFLAMEKLGAKKENTVYVGDSEVDLLTAENSGLDCISAAWGFRSKDFLIEHGAKTIISNPEQILLLI